LFSELHKAYGKMRVGNYSKKNVQEFKQAVVDNGLTPGSRFDKVLEDPEPHFNKIVKEIENFRSPPRLDWVKDSHEPSHPRYKKQTPVAVGTPNQDKLRLLTQYERDQITRDELKHKLGEEQFRRIESTLKNAEDGKFTSTAHELVLDQAERHHFNSNPVRNSTEVFSKYNPPNYGRNR
jgi:hypothetical protein